MSTNNAVNVGLSGSTGTGNFVGSTGASLTTPKVVTSINDTNNNELIKVTATASAINEVTVANAAISGSPVISATGDDTNISLSLIGKGTGGVPIKGTSTNDSATAGYVGELISSVIAFASRVSLSNGVNANVTSISLTAGDWDVWGNVSGLASTAFQNGYNWISTTSATLPDDSLYSGMNGQSATALYLNAPFKRISLSGTTTVYLSCQFAFAAGTAAACGGIYARRVR